MKTPHKSLSHFDETPGQFWTRLRNGGARKPLRTLKEMAVEFSVSVPTLSATMRHDPNAPKSIYRTGGNGRPRNTWIDPDAVRAWWKARGEK